MTNVAELRADANHVTNVLFILAIEKLRRNNVKGAQDHLVEALRMAPDNPTYLSYFGYCVAVCEKDYLRAIKLCRRAVRAGSKEAIHYVNLSRVYRLKGDRKSAFETLQFAFRVRKRHPAVATDLARLGIRRPPMFTFLRRTHPVNKCLGMLRAHLERKWVGHRQS